MRKALFMFFFATLLTARAAGGGGHEVGNGRSDFAEFLKKRMKEVSEAAIAKLEDKKDVQAIVRLEEFHQDGSLIVQTALSPSGATRETKYFAETRQLVITDSPWTVFDVSKLDLLMRFQAHHYILQVLNVADPTYAKSLEFITSSLTNWEAIYFTAKLYQLGLATAALMHAQPTEREDFAKRLESFSTSVDLILNAQAVKKYLESKRSADTSTFKSLEVALVRLSINAADLTRSFAGATDISPKQIELAQILLEETETLLELVLI